MEGIYIVAIIVFVIPLFAILCMISVDLICLAGEVLVNLYDRIADKLENLEKFL